MFASPNKLLLIALVAFAVWYATRWVGGPSRRTVRRGPAAAAPPATPAVEDLVACRVCGAYVAASARFCGKPGCPQPR